MDSRAYADPMYTMVVSTGCEEKKKSIVLSFYLKLLIPNMKDLIVFGACPMYTVAY